MLPDKHLFYFIVLQVDENAPQQQSSSVIVTDPDDNVSLSGATTTLPTTRNDDRASPVNHHTLRKKINHYLTSLIASHFVYKITQISGSSGILLELKNKTDRSRLSK